MAISYSWNCKNVDTYPTGSDNKNDVIHTICWQYTATEGEYSAQETGVTHVDTDDLSSFTEFSNLTNSDIVGWVEPTISYSRLREMKSKLDAQINKKKSPTSVPKQVAD